MNEVARGFAEIEHTIRLATALLATAALVTTVAVRMTMPPSTGFARVLLLLIYTVQVAITIGSWFVTLV